MYRVVRYSHIIMSRLNVHSTVIYSIIIIIRVLDLLHSHFNVSKVRASGSSEFLSERFIINVDCLGAGFIHFIKVINR